MSRALRIAIIGAGPGGICAAIQLRRAGHTDITIFEKADAPGGTWYLNQYPGCACDVPAHLYSFSFELKRDWSRPYAEQPEILEYFNHCVDKYGLRPHMRLSTAITDAYWDEECTLWRLVTEHQEEVEADVVISALGMFNELNHPEINDLEKFTGTVFHSARWDRDHDLTGERVALIGTAASAVQCLPLIAAQADQLYVFQRSASWVLPKVDDPFTPEQLDAFRNDPVAARNYRLEIWRNLEALITFSKPRVLAASERAGLRNLEVVNDPEVRRKLTPTVPWGCHRPLTSNVFYPVFNQPNVELVTEPIVRTTADEIVTADGTARGVDTIILATGFHPTKYLSAINVVGRKGERIADAWNAGAQAYLGITTSGYPNLFMLYGPNTNNGSILFMIECQVAYVVRMIDRMRREGLAWFDVRRDVMDAYNDEIQRDLDHVAVWQGACNNYYRAESGRIVTQWPRTMAEYRDRTMRPDDEAYEVHFGAPLGQV